MGNILLLRVLLELFLNLQWELVFTPIKRIDQTAVPLVSYNISIFEFIIVYTLTGSTSFAEVLDFICPSIGSNPPILRFGDHDRLAHPKSCRHFYMCLLTGMPRYVYSTAMFFLSYWRLFSPLVLEAVHLDWFLIQCLAVVISLRTFQDGKLYYLLLFIRVNIRKYRLLTLCSEKWYGEEDLMEEEDGSSKPGSAVSPSLSSKISTSSASLSPSAEPVKLEPIFKPDSQPLRRLSAGTNRFSRTQHEANMDSSESNSRVAL